MKLRYGTLTTEYEHVTIIADGRILLTNQLDNYPAGPTIMSMKAWASSSQEAVDMATRIGKELGFQVTGRVDVYDTEPGKPPRENPFGYDMDFVPYDEEPAGQK